jgi:hypothetical protein
MKVPILKLALLVAVVCPVAVVRGADGPATGAPAKPTAAAKSSTDDPEMAKDFKGRLPPNFAKLVSDAQKKKIYLIESDYAPKVKALRDQLRALTAQEDQEIRAVLTPEQLKKLDELTAESKAKRNGGKPMDDPGSKATESTLPKATAAPSAKATGVTGATPAATK